MIRMLMETEEWSPKELAAIGVVHGPGSFTGVRVGLSAAKGLSEAWQVPLVAVSRLALLAAAAGEVHGKVGAALDAGRGEFYCGVYEGRSMVTESLLTIKELAVMAEHTETLVVCEQRVAEALGSLGPHLVEEPKAADALPLVVERVFAGEFDDPAALDANYLRRTDLEIFARQTKPVAGGS
jgi:tRNA threonylcarbamoyladenosine biosynthesis protein TsaB